MLWKILCRSKIKSSIKYLDKRAHWEIITKSLLEVLTEDTTITSKLSGCSYDRQAFANETAQDQDIGSEGPFFSTR